MTHAIHLSEEVSGAIADGKPVVALESSVISQGLPRPRNLEAAQACEAAIREGGGTPATIAVLDGVLRVGLAGPELRRMAEQDGIDKAGARDLAWSMVAGRTMATTVGASIVAARATGIRVMATGGIGGIHRGYEAHLDASHDLVALAETPVIVVSAGFKSILDLPRTLEYLETTGVLVLGYGTNRLPGFYTLDSEFEIPLVPNADAVARTYAAQRALGLLGGFVVTNPPPSRLAFERRYLEKLIDRAEGDAQEAGVTGKLLTPYLLGRIADLTDGKSVELNIELLLANARVACEIAVAMAALAE